MSGGSAAPKWDGITPIILWVDDHHENNAEERAFAAKSGVRFALAADTEAALEFLNLHRDRLSALDPGEFRIITDATRAMRWAGGDEEDRDAGISLIDVASASFARTPILVYCGEAGLKRFTEKAYLDHLEDRVCITTEQATCLHFITMGDLSGLRLAVCGKEPSSAAVVEGK